MTSEDDGIVVLDKRWQIELARIASICGVLSLINKGVFSKRPKMMAMLRKEFGFTGRTYKEAHEHMLKIKKEKEQAQGIGSE